MADSCSVRDVQDSSAVRVWATWSIHLRPCFQFFSSNEFLDHLIQNSNTPSSFLFHSYISKIRIAVAFKHSYWHFLNDWGHFCKDACPWSKHTTGLRQSWVCNTGLPWHQMAATWNAFSVVRVAFHHFSVFFLAVGSHCLLVFICLAVTSLYLLIQDFFLPFVYWGNEIICFVEFFAFWILQIISPWCHLTWSCIPLNRWFRPWSLIRFSFFARILNRRHRRQHRLVPTEQTRAHAVAGSCSVMFKIHQQFGGCQPGPPMIKFPNSLLHNQALDTIIYHCPEPCFG